jgi:hypothetical protein
MVFDLSIVFNLKNKIMKNLIIFSLFTLFGCKQVPFASYVSRIIVKTSTNDSLICFVEYNNSNIHYPDTSLPIGKPFKQLIKLNKPYYLDKTGKDNTWANYIATLPVDTLCIFILDAKIFADSSWQTIRDKYLVLKRYDLSAEQLKNMNFTINYP